MAAGAEAALPGGTDGARPGSSDKARVSRKRGKHQPWCRVPLDLPGSVSSTAVGLFVALMRFARNKAPHTCYPSQAALCNLVLRQTNEGVVPVSVKTIQRAQKELVDARRLVVMRRKNKTSLFTLYPDKLAPDPRPNAGPGSDPRVATGSDSRDRLDASLVTDELKPLELELTTGLGGIKHTGEQAGSPTNASSDFTKEIHAVCPASKRDFAAFMKCRETVASCQRIYDDASVVEALRQLARRPVSMAEFQPALRKLCDEIAPPPF